MKTIAIDTNYPPANARILSAPEGGKPLAQPLQAVDMCADVLRVFFVGNNPPNGSSTLVIAGRGIGEVNNVFFAAGTKVDGEVAWDFSISLATQELAEFIGAKENVSLKVGVSATIEGGSATEWQMLWNVSRTAIGDNDPATLPHVQTLVSQAETAAQSATASAESAATKAAEASTSATNARDEADRARGYADQVNPSNFYTRAAADDLFATKTNLNTLTSPASEMSRGTVLLAGGIDDAGVVSVPTASVVKSYVESIVSAMYHYRGSVASYADLPSSGQMAGDVWNVTAAYGNYPAGTNFAWTGSAWDSLGGVVDVATTSTAGVIKLGAPTVLDSNASWLCVNANGQAGIRQATAIISGAIKLATSTTLGDKMGYVGLNSNGQAGIGLASSTLSGTVRLNGETNMTVGGKIGRNSNGQLFANTATETEYGVVMPTSDVEYQRYDKYLPPVIIDWLIGHKIDAIPVVGYGTAIGLMYSQGDSSVEGAPVVCLFGGGPQVDPAGARGEYSLGVVRILDDLNSEADYAVPSLSLLRETATLQNVLNNQPLVGGYRSVQNPNNLEILHSAPDLNPGGQPTNLGLVQTDQANAFQSQRHNLVTGLIDVAQAGVSVDENGYWNPSISIGTYNVQGVRQTSKVFGFRDGELVLQEVDATVDPQRTSQKKPVFTELRGGFNFVSNFIFRNAASVRNDDGSILMLMTDCLIFQGVDLFQRFLSFPEFLPGEMGRVIATDVDILSRHAIGDVVMRTSNTAPAVAGQTWTPAGTVTTAGTGAGTIYAFKRTS